MASSKQLHFQGPYHPQNWSLPDSLIYSITMYPLNSKGYQKFIKSCKYFFAKNPILVITKIKYEYRFVDKKYGVSLNSYKPIFDIEKYFDFINALVNTSIKLWISDEFSPHLLGPKSFILPKIHRCDAQHKVIVKNDEIVPLENLVKAMPKVKDFFLYDKYDSSCITQNTIKKLLELPHFSLIASFYVYQIPEIFDFEIFYTYLKKNKQTKFRIQFRDTISEAYKIQLEEIVDEIIDAENHDYKIPDIYYDGANSEKFNKLHSLFLQIL